MFDKFSGAVIFEELGGQFVNLLVQLSNPEAVKSDKIEASKVSFTKILQLKDSGSNEVSGLVAAAFAALSNPEAVITKKPSHLISEAKCMDSILDSQIQNANSINSLLLVAENAVVSRRHALKMVSVLSEWSNSNKVKITDFEKDPRFLKLCRILARSPSAQTLSSLTMAEDLSTVLGITGDDEAARLIANLSLGQMIKVMKALVSKGRRSPPLLRALSHNITRQAETIDLKKSADLLFSMASLNFPDPVLLDRICSDVIECLDANKDKPSVVTSIVVSLGLMRYRHEAVLGAIAGWMQGNQVARPQDLASTVVTLATVNFIPQEMDELFDAARALKEEEMSKSASWLDLVWALLVLRKADNHHLSSVLLSDFMDKLLSFGEIPIPLRRKLRMIEAYAQLSGLESKLPAETFAELPVMRPKEKAVYISSLLDTFKTIVSAEAFLKKDCDSGMGFLYDAEFAVDAKCHPIPLDKAANDKSVFRIAVLGLDYHDMTRGVPVPLGLCKLAERLLTMKGYKVLRVPYTEFNPKDKLITRAQYINSRLKQLVTSKPTEQCC
ncbi:hypothetical protein ACJJTC_016808 [Scirpophaga incertulas]